MPRPIRAEAKTGQPLKVRLSPAERLVLKTAALVNGQNISQFARDALVTAAEDCLETTTLKGRHQC